MESNKNETEGDTGDQSAGVDEPKETPEFTTEELQAAIGRDEETKDEADLQRSAKTKRLHTRSMAKNRN